MRANRHTACTVFLIAVLANLLIISTSVGAQELTPVTIGVSGTGLDFLPAVIAKAKGFTEKHGLDVTYISMSGGTPAVQAMVAGEYPIAAMGTTIMHAHLQGFDPVIIATFTPNMPYHFVGRRGITSAEDLRGGRVAISAPGSTSDGVVRLALTRLGLRPEIDTAIIPIGGGPARLAAMEAGTVDATVLAPPQSYQLLEQGYTMILDLIAEQIPSNHENVVTTRRVIEENPDLLKRYVKAISEALHYIHTEREGIIEFIAEYLEMDLERERHIIERAYDDMVTYNYPRKPYPLVAGWRNALEIGTLQNPELRNIDPWDVMDVRFVRELEEEGFFDALYE